MEKENSPGTSLGIQQLVKEPEDVKRFYDANKDLDVDYMVSDQWKAPQEVITGMRGKREMRRK